MDFSLPHYHPDELSLLFKKLGIQRAYLAYDPASHGVRASHPELAPLADFIGQNNPNFSRHEAIFLATGQKSQAVFGAFIHRTLRGQSQGGLRLCSYRSVGDFLNDGLRLSVGMTRKIALAGLWWGGGKGILAKPVHCDTNDANTRQTIYREYGQFVSSLQGAYITAEDAGTRSEDMAHVFSQTRFTTCIPVEVGGSGNPSPATAKGVVCAMEAALAYAEMGSLAGKRIVMQGTGNVGTAMIELLIARGVDKIIASEVSATRCQMLRDQFAHTPLEIHQVEPGDQQILSVPCDILAPNALGGILNPATIPTLRTAIICGAANNQLLSDERDGLALAERGILYVPDFVANRMGIVHCANEQYGYLHHDPAILRHFDPTWDGSIAAITKKTLTLAQRDGISTAQAANQLADQAAMEPHPIWGNRAQMIVQGLLNSGWAEQYS